MKRGKWKAQTAMEFQNKSPEEVVRRYRRNVRLKQGLVILVLLAYMAFVMRDIWRNNTGFLTLLPKTLIVLLAPTPVSFWIAWDFIALNAILNVNCDPVTYVQVMHLLGQARNSRRSAITIQINEAVGNMWTGRFSEALALVKSLPALYGGAITGYDGFQFCSGAGGLCVFPAHGRNGEA